MMQEETLAFKTAGSVSKKKFSKIPLIRKFESLVSDEEFESAGFKIARHPHSETSLIIPAGQYLFTDDDINSNRLVGDRLYLHTFSVPAIDRRPTFAASIQIPKVVVERVQELRSIASEEKIEFSDNSAQEALEWLRNAAPPSTPRIFLLNNGNLRFLWKREGSQLGIQFLGNGTGQFVFLGEDDQTERIFGSLKVAELLRRISGLDLLGVLGF